MLVPAGDIGAAALAAGLGASNERTVLLELSENGMPPGTQSQDTGSYRTTRVVYVEFESRVMQGSPMRGSGRWRMRWRRTRA